MEGVAQVASGILTRDVARLRELLARLPDGSDVLDEALEAAAMNKWEGTRMMAMLLNQRGARIIPSQVVKAAAGNERIGKEVLMLLLEQPGADIIITEEVVKVAAENWGSGETVIKLLLEQRGLEEVVKAAVGNEGSGREVIILLLGRQGVEVAITEEAVKTIVGKFRKEVMILLLEQWGSEVVVTEEVVKAAAGNRESGKEVMMLLLEQRGAEVVVTEEVVNAAAGNEESGKEVMMLLLEQRGAEVVITEEIVKAAAGNRESGEEVMMLLLEQRGVEVVITEEVVKAAAGNWKSGEEVMMLLLEQRGAEVVITEEAVKTIIGKFRKEVIILLLEQWGSEVVITEEVVKAAAGNEESGEEVMMLLLGRGAEVVITEEAIKTIAGKFRKEVMILLLGQRGLEVVITEEVIKAAAGNYGNGEKGMLLLLEKWRVERVQSDGHVPMEQSKDLGFLAEAPRQHVMDLQNNTRENYNPSETSDYQAPSGLSVPSELQTRKILRLRNFSLPNILHRLYLGVLLLLRPRLDVGQRRLEWQCNCGIPLYGDFQGDDKEIDKLVMEIQDHGFFVTQSGHGAKRLLSGSGKTTASDFVSPPPPRSNASQATRNSSINILQVTDGMPNTTNSGIDIEASLSTSASAGLKSVALCVNNGLFHKSYDEVDISSIPRDTQMFQYFKRAYEAYRSSRTNVIKGWLTKPVDINYIQFVVEGLKHVYPIADSPDCTICAHRENKDELVVERGYERHPPTLALAHPPIPPNLFFHLWECPGDITPALQTMWLNRLPKKLDEKLEKLCLGTRPDGEIIYGWGILVIEGIHKQRISRLTAGMATLAIVISVAYSAIKKDVSSGFAIGALIVTCWTVFITALHYEFHTLKWRLL